MSYEISVEKVAALTGHSGAVYALESGPGATLFSAGSDQVVAEWDLRQPGEGQMVAKIPSIVYSLLHLPGQELLLAGQSGGGIHVINLATRAEERLLQYHEAAVFRLLLSNKNKLLFSLSGDGELGVMDAATFSLVKKIKVGTGKLRGAATDNDEKMLAIGSMDGTISVYALPGMELLNRWQAHREGFSVNALAFSPDGDLLLSGSRDAHLNLFDVKAGFLPIQSIPAHNYAIYTISYSHDRKLFATASRDKTIKLWDPHSLEVMQRIDHEKSGGHVNSVNTLLWHPHTGQLITAGDDRSVLVWEVKMQMGG